VCLPKSPRCTDCPVFSFCDAYKANTQNSIPVKKRKVKIRSRIFYYFVFDYNNKTSLTERTGGDIWKGLFEFPLYETDSEINGDDIVTIANEKWGVQPESIKNIRISKQYKHVLTHQRIYATFITIELTTMPKKIKLDTNLKMIQTKPVSRLTEIFLSKDEKFI
jgi:A/G-specific adenine glycosylase